MSEMNLFIENSLKEMGFEEKKIKKALSTGVSSVEAAMDWIVSHADDVDDDEEEVALTDNTPSDAPALRVEKTPEELEAAKQKLEELRKKKQLEREERERQDEIEREKMRRKTGNEIKELREKHEEQERLRIAQERKRDKLEDQVHRQKILDQIKADREAQKRRSEGKPVVEASTDKPLTPAAQPKTASDSCRLALKLPDGSNLQNDFNSKEPLAAVKVFVQLNRKDMPEEHPDAGNITFKLPPATLFTQEDMERPLIELGLCPSSRLIVVQGKSLHSQVPSYY